jgi:hypothetical protein
MADEQTCEMELTLHHLLQGPELMSVTDLWKVKVTFFGM